MFLKQFQDDMEFYFQRVQNQQIITQDQIIQLFNEIYSKNLIKACYLEIIEDNQDNDENVITIKQKSTENENELIYKITKINNEKLIEKKIQEDAYSILYQNSQHVVLSLKFSEYEIQKRVFQTYEINQNNFYKLRKLQIFNKSLDFSVADAIKVGKELEYCKNLKYLDISLKSNSIGAQGVVALFKNIHQCQNITQFFINLGNCGIGKDGFKAIIQCFDNPFKDLKELVIKLSGNSIFEFEIVQNLVEQINKLVNIEALEIDLSYCSFQGDKDRQLIAFQENSFMNLKKLSLKLKYFYFSFPNQNHLSTKNSFCKIPFSLQFSFQNILELKIDLNYNYASPQDVMDLFQSLEKSQQLQKLSLLLSYAIINLKCAVLISQSIRILNNLTHLHLDLSLKKQQQQQIKDNTIGKKDIIQLFQFLNTKKEFEFLQLDFFYRQFDLESFNYLLEKIAQQTKLRTLNISLSKLMSKNVDMVFSTVKVLPKTIISFIFKSDLSFSSYHLVKDLPQLSSLQYVLLEIRPFFVYRNKFLNYLLKQKRLVKMKIKEIIF